MTDLIGRSLDRYHILEQLGEGGMATVYKAYDTRLERDVAVKVIRVDQFTPASLQGVLARFEREAKSLARLSHPNIVGIIDYGEHEGVPYLVMVYLPGGTLKEKLGKPMPWGQAARLLLPVAEALAYAHEHSIIHRDVKPSNILLTEKGQPMVTDFGIAKLLDTGETHGLTATGMAIGTPEYMAPEQGLGRGVDARADVYSLGVVFYELVTGRKPFEADTPMAVVLKHVSDPLPRPQDLLPGLPDQVEKVLIKALAKNPEDRYASMQEMSQALENLFGPGGTPAPSPAQERPDQVSALPPETTESLETNIQTGSLDTDARPRTASTASTSAREAPAQPVAPPSRTAHIPSWALWAIGLVAVIIIGMLIVPRLAPAWFSGTVGAGSTQISDKDGMVLDYVPAGEFTMGIENGPGDTEPVHTVELEAYWIDQTEVTIAMYYSCVQVGVCTPPADSSSAWYTSYYGNPQYDNYPVVFVDWQQAKAYCEWAGRRLPTEAEWEKAARGSDARLYPWGNEAANCDRLSCEGNGYAALQVGSYPDGASPYGALDMAGSVWEWVADWYSDSYYAQSPQNNPVGPSSGDVRSKRGGTSEYVFNYWPSAYRAPLESSAAEDVVGFRCAQGTSH